MSPLSPGKCKITSHTIHMLPTLLSKFPNQLCHSIAIENTSSMVPLEFPSIGSRI